MGLLYVPVICGTLTEQEAQSLEQLGQHHVVMLEGKYKKGWRTAHTAEPLRQNQGSTGADPEEEPGLSAQWEAQDNGHKSLRDCHRLGKTRHTKTRNQKQNQRTVGVELEAQPGKITKNWCSHTSQENRLLPGK